jgi:hypothetical protein
MQLDAVANGKEGIENDDEILNTSDPPSPSPSPEPEPQSMSLQQAKDLDPMVFFTGFEPSRGGLIIQEARQSNKICKLCSYVQISSYLSWFLMTSSAKYGSDKSTIPAGLHNFIFRSNTAKVNLQEHIYKVHGFR